MISKDVNNLFFRFFMDISVPFVTTKIFLLLSQRLASFRNDQSIFKSLSA